MKIKILSIKQDGYQFKEIENDYEAFNNELEWDDAWNTPTIQVKGVRYIVVCSDLGKVRHEKVSVLGYDNVIAPKEALQEPFMVGNVIITKFDGIDDFESLNDSDIAILESRLYQHHYIYDSEFFKTILVID